MSLKHIFLCVLLIFSSKTQAQPASESNSENLSGIWKNDDQPVWIEILQQENNLKGTFNRVEHNPDLEGRVILKDFSRTDGAWTGEVFAVRLGEFKTATLTARSPTSLSITVKVGFMQRTVNWTRDAND